MKYSNILPITFSRLNCSLLLSSDPIDFKILKTVIENDFQSEVVAFINQYYSYSDRGTVNYVTVSDDFEILSNSSVEIVLQCEFNYDVTYYNGCKDLDHTDEDQFMTITVKINKNNCSLEIIGDKIYEREPDEY